MNTTLLDRLDLSPKRVRAGLSSAELVERAVAAGEGQLAANGALVCLTGDRTGRSPNDKYLEDSPGIHNSIGWGKVNQPISPANFAKLEKLARQHLSKKPELFRFDGYAGADPSYRLKVTVITEEAWHSLFAKTLFINAPASELARFEPDWTIINACNLRLENAAEYGVKGPVAIVQSL